MSLLIDNSQDIYDTAEIEKLAGSVFEKTLEARHMDKNYEVSLTFVDNEEIRRINNIYRDIDFPTDVLSFPMIDYKNRHGKNSIEDMDLDSGEIVLGDIVISLERAYEQAVDYGHSFQREIAFLMVHGMLHLLGYDHEEENDRKEMRAEEEKILSSLHMER